MKRLILLLSLCPLVSVAAPPPVPFTLSWQDTNAIPLLSQYVPTTNDCYVLTGTNVANAPQPWPVLAVFTNWTFTTNSQGVWFNAPWQAVPGQMFFSIVTSNFWGVTLPSNVAQTGPASTPSVNLNLSR